MAGPTLSRLWGEMLITGLLLLLTATLITGETKQCGEERVCGYGAKCYNDTSECVCLSDGDELMSGEGYPNAVFYCLGEDVTQCGYQLCGHEAECDTARTVCRCSSHSGVLTQLKDTTPSLWYCVETCSSGNRYCPEDTTCKKDPIGGNIYRCYCSAGATRSSTGQCPGNASTSTDDSTVHITTSSASPPQHDSRTLVIGVAAGGGGAVVLAVIVLIVVVLARKRKTKRRDGSGTDSLRSECQRPHQSKALNSRAYESVIDPMPHGLSGANSSGGPIVIVRTEVSVMNPASRPGAYEDVDNDIGVFYSTAKVTGQQDKRKTYTREDLWNHTIPANKAQEREGKNLLESSDNVPNQYNTLCHLTPTKGNGDGLQPAKTGRGNTDEGPAHYSAAYSNVGARGGNTEPPGPASKGDVEYEEIKLPKV